MTHTPDFPTYETLELSVSDSVLTILLNRPKSRNAMSRQMVEELLHVMETTAPRTDIRVVVLRGAAGTFCSGGDIKDMASIAAPPSAPAVDTAPDPALDPAIELNRLFGHMLQTVNALPQATIALLEGTVLGGGFGLACVTDIAFAHTSAQFGLPETRLGIIPAQIAPYIVQRIGLTQGRRLAVTGGRFDGYAAFELGLVHEVHDTTKGLEAAAQSEIQNILDCAPAAVAATKHLMLSLSDDFDSILDAAAEQFARQLRGPEGREGTLSFIQKRKPSWATASDENTTPTQSKGQTS